jgi:hypothetical protein
MSFFWWGFFAVAFGTFRWWLPIVVHFLGCTVLSPVGRSTTKLLASVSGPTVATYQFTFGRNRCYIQADLDTSHSDHDTLLATSYIAFLFRFFSICDVNHIRLISDYLLANVGDRSDSLPKYFSAHSARLHGIIMKTYSEAVQKASEQVFKGVPPGFEGYSLDAVNPEDTRVPHMSGRLGTYTLRVTSDFVPLFDMTAGPQSVELPQLVLLFYVYLVDRLHEPAAKLILDDLIRQQIASHDRWDPTSSQTMTQGAKRLLADLIRRQPSATEPVQRVITP